MSSGQVLSVVVCSGSVPAGGAFPVSGSMTGVCPNGQVAYVVPAYVPFSESAAAIDGVMSPFDPAIGSGIFSFGFGVVVVFYLIGLKGSVLVRPFWSSWR